MRWVKISISAIFIVVIAYFLSRIDLESVIGILSGSNYILLVIALLIIIFVYFLKSLRLKLIASYYKHDLSIKDSFITTVSSITLATFTPGRVGEFSKIYLLNRYGIKKMAPFAIGILERVFDLFIVTLFSSIFIISIIQIKNLMIAAIIFFILFALGILSIINVHRFKFMIPGRFHKHVDQIKVRLNDFRFYLIFLNTVLIWVIDAVFLYLVLISIGVKITYLITLGLYSSLIILSILSFLPGGLGTLDVSIFLIFRILGIPDEISVVVLLVIRIVTFIIPLLLLWSILPWIDFNIFSIRKKTKKNLKT